MSLLRVLRSLFVRLEWLLDLLQVEEACGLTHVLGSFVKIIPYVPELLTRNRRMVLEVVDGV